MFLFLSIRSSVDPQYYSSPDKLWSNIMYCNLMLESVLSEPALLTLSTEILAVKGPLPVGEIGKILAETTSIGSLSQKLKERFGGLKKFLERFQNTFVISNDHPFNPNVLLRSSLSAEHLDLIDRGIFPHQLLQKTKKVRFFIMSLPFLARHFLTHFLAIFIRLRLLPRKRRPLVLSSAALATAAGLLCPIAIVLISARRRISLWAVLVLPCRVT